jgi:hypothetical protein
MRFIKTPIPALSRIRGGEEQPVTSRTKSKTKSINITQKMQDVIDRLERNDNNPIKPPFDIKETDEEIMQAYENIFMNK